MWTEYEPYIRKLCSYKLQGLPDYIDDCVQDVFLEMSIALDKGTEIKYPKAWLTKVANNKINDIYKNVQKERNNIVSLEIAINEKQSDFNYDEITEEQVELKLQTILDSLTNEETALFEDFFVNKKKQKEIAFRMGISENLVSQKVFRLKRKIIKYLQIDN